MSIRFPKWCKTAAQRSEHARRVVSVRWKRCHEGAPKTRVHIGYIEIGGALAAGMPMRLDLVAIADRQKWEGWSDGKRLGIAISERTITRMIRAILRTPRQNPLQSPSGFGDTRAAPAASAPFASRCEALAGEISTIGEYCDQAV